MKKSLSKKSVEHLAKLAKLELSKKEFEKYSKDLSGILDYVSEISKLNLKNIQSASCVVSLENKMRQDKIQKLEVKNANPVRYFKTKVVLNNA